MKTTATGKLVLMRTGSCAIAAMAILWVGCDNNHLLGAVDGGPNQSNDAGLPPAGDASNDGAIVMPVQSWTGYVENYQFTSGSDAVKISFAVDPAGNLIGAVILGNGTPPPPATDPSVGYPPGLFSYPDEAWGALTYVAEGYAYPMHNGTLDGQRLRFGVDLQDLWRDWCALQTPLPGSSGCLPNWAGMATVDTCAQTNPTTGEIVPVDCGKFGLCQLTMMCVCDASGCQLQDHGATMMFDISINNNRADGSMDANNVHFTKDP